MGRIRVLFLLSISVILLSTGIIYAQEKLGLIIIAHGSPMSQWNMPVLKLEKEVRSIISEEENNPFSEIKVALMEFSEPSISTVIKDMEDIGIDKIYSIPLFIAPSGHSLYDIPTILGLYSDKEMIERIKEEATIVNTKIKITIGPTLNTGDVLKEVILDRVKELSAEPDSEGVVLLAHGDTRFEPIWASMCREIGTYVCAETGIKYFDYAFVEIGQSFISEGVPVILKASDKHKTTLVVGLYLSMGVDKMALGSTLSIGMMKMESKDIFVGKNIIFAKRGLLPDKRISEWIADRAMEYITGMQ